MAVRFKISQQDLIFAWENIYGYVANNPLSYVDPTGESAESVLRRAWPTALGFAAADGPSPIGDIIGAAVITGLIIYDMCQKDEEPCENEVKHCEQICEDSMLDPKRQNVWGGSWNICMKGCVSQRCGGNRVN